MIRENFIIKRFISKILAMNFFQKRLVVTQVIIRFIIAYLVRVTLTELKIRTQALVKKFTKQKYYDSMAILFIITHSTK